MDQDEQVFSFQESKEGTVFLFWHGKRVMTLKGEGARRFLAKVDGATTEQAQLAMAKVTGNFKRGNERKG